MSSNETAGGAGGGSGGPGGASDAGGAPPSAFGVSDDVLVYWLDIVLLCILGAFFLAFLPRTIGRLSNLHEWTRGLILRKGTPPPQELMRQPVGRNDKLYPVTTRESFGEGVSSDVSHTLADHNAPSRYVKDWASMPSERGYSIPPTHVRSFSTVFHPITKIFTYPMDPNQTVGGLLMRFIYAGGILFTALNGNSPITGPLRLGFVAVSQLPVVIALGTKNNVIGMLTGIGYEKLNFLHRTVGTFTFFMANFHAVGYLNQFILGGTPEALDAPFVKYGFTAFYGVTILFIATIGPIRQNSYLLFLLMHMTGTILFVVGLWFHQPFARKYIILALGIYGLDHLFRIIKTRFARAQLIAIPELGLTRVEVPSVGAGWRSGQHVRLRVLSGSMGPLGWATAHPFTIASAGDSPDGKGMVLMCKKAGGWTKRLYRAASQSGGAGAEEVGYNRQIVREMKVIIEGPYGGVGNMVLSSYSSVLLVAGGSGIAFGLSAAEELVCDIHAGKSSVKFIELIWSTQEKASLAPMIPTFSSLLSSMANLPGVILRITVHYTRAEKPPTDGGKVNAMLDAHLATLGPNLTLQPGRPPLQRITSTIARLTAGVPDARGLAVAVCGPGGLGFETAKAVRAVDDDVRRGCGGVELHQEVFGY